MNPTPHINASALIDEQPIGRAQLFVFFLAFLIATFDGLDTQIIGYIALEMSKEWNITRAALGSVLSVGLFGIMLGSLSLGVLGDMIGQRRVLIALTALIGALTIASGFAQSAQQLMFLRFFTGFCVGGALPNNVALLSQFAPARRRAAVLSIVGVGFALGAALGGLVAAMLLPEPGWRNVFHLAGGLALLLVPFLIAFLPESIPGLLKLGQQSRAQLLLRKLFPNRDTENAIVIWPIKNKTTMPVAALFQNKRTVLTILMWLTFMMSLLNAYLLPNWLPTLLQDAKVPTQEAVIATSGLSIAGMIGSLFFGWCIDRFGFAKTLVSTYFLGAFCVAVLAFNAATLGSSLLVATVFIVGFFIIGSQGGLNTLPSLLYPAEIRSTATGWALGLGRVGSITGPLLAGYLMTVGWTHVDVLLIATVAAAMAAILLFAMSLYLRSQKEQS